MRQPSCLREPLVRSHLTLVIVPLVCILLTSPAGVHGRETPQDYHVRGGGRLLKESNDEGGKCDCTNHPLGRSENACEMDRRTYCSCTVSGCSRRSCAQGELFSVLKAKCERVNKVAYGRQLQARDDDKKTDPPKETKEPKETKAPKDTLAPKVTPALNTPAPLLPSLTAVPITPAPTPVVVVPTPVVTTSTPVTLPPTTETLAPTPVATLAPLVPSTAAPVETTVSPAPIPVVTTATPAPTPVTTPLTTINPIETPVVSPSLPPADVSGAPVVPTQNVTLSPAFNISAPSTPGANFSVNGSSTVVLPPAVNGTSGNATFILPTQTLPGKSKGGSKTGVVVAAVAATAGAVVLVAVCAAIWWCCRERVPNLCGGGAKKGSGFRAGPRHTPAGFVSFADAPPTPEIYRTGSLGLVSSPSPAPSPRTAMNPLWSPQPSPAFSKIYPFPYRDLKQATSNFSEAHLMGEGGFGKVYFGRLVDGVKVAVKRAAPGRKETGEQFRNEVDFLGRVHHKHLVSLVGYCQENGEQMLVYELMSEGSLSSHLYGMRPERTVAD